MSIESVNELFDEQSGSEDQTGLTATRVFQVIATESTDRVPTILAASGLPSTFDQHPNDSQIICNKKIPRAVAEAQGADDTDPRYIWNVTCTYVPRRAGAEVVTLEEPTDRPPVVKFSSRRYMVPVIVAYDHRKITGNFPDDVTTADPLGGPTKEVINSANDPFDPPLMEPRYNKVITIDRNEEEYDFSSLVIDLFLDSTNTEQIIIGDTEIPRFQGLFTDIRANQQWRPDGSAYFAVHYEIEIDKRTHVKRLLDQGYYDINDNPFRDNTGEFKTVPTLLDGDGREKAEESPAVFYATLTKYPMPWDILDLPKWIKESDR